MYKDFKQKVEAKYQVEAALMDSIKKFAKKSLMVLVGLGMFSSMAQGLTLTQPKLDRYKKDMHSAVQDSAGNQDVTVDAKVKDAGGSHVVTFTYKSGDGSARSIRLIQSKNGNHVNMEMKQTKNAEGYVNEAVEMMSDLMFKDIKDAIHKEGIKVK